MMSTTLAEPGLNPADLYKNGILSRSQFPVSFAVLSISAS